MKLANGELRPGIILEVMDNKGTIKASVPGIFSAQDVDVLPPIRPWASSVPNSFTTPTKGDEVWVLSFTDNPECLWWFRKDDAEKNNGELNRGGMRVSGGKAIQDLENVQVLCSKEAGLGWATIYFSDGTGWIIQNQDAVIKLDPDGNILITNGHPHGTIHVTDNGISLGTKDVSAHPACYGDSVAKLFDNIIDTLSAISEAAKSSPYTATIAAAITSKLLTFENDADYITSDYVTID